MNVYRLLKDNGYNVTKIDHKLITDSNVVGKGKGGIVYHLNDNSCFEWAYYNGSVVSNNFVDYYRTIYYPKATKKQTFVGPLSYSNQYQAFRYFYYAEENIQSVTFSSNADAFNWNDPSSLDKLQHYIPLTYTNYYYNDVGPMT